MVATLDKVKNVWTDVKDIFITPHTEKQYKHIVSILDSLIDEVGENEKHPLAPLMETLGHLIEVYETNYLPEFTANNTDVLIHFMELHNLSQKDLKEIGSQGVVSEIISGKRQLNIRQIKALSKRFKVSPAVFI